MLYKLRVRGNRDMKKMNRVTSLALACVMATSIAGAAFAAPATRAIEDNLQTSGTTKVEDLVTGTKTGNSEVKLQVINGTFGDKVAGNGKLSVIIPATIPMMMDNTGAVRTPKKITLVNNNVTNEVKINKVKIATEGGWSLVAADDKTISNSVGSAGEKKLAFVVGVGADDTNDKPVDASGDLNTSGEDAFKIPADGELNIRLIGKGCESVTPQGETKVATISYDLTVTPL